MKNNRRIMHLILVLFIIAPIFSAEAESSIDFIVYLPDAAFRENTEAFTAISSLEKWLTKALGTEVQGHLYQKESDLNTYIATVKPAFGLCDIRYFLKNHSSLNMVPLVIPRRGNNTSMNSVLVVRKDSGMKNIFDVKGKTLATIGIDPVSINFLSNVVFEGLIDAGTFFTVTDIDTSQSAMMALSYKEIDAAVVDQALLLETPQWKKDYTVVMTSRDILLPPVFVFESNVTPSVTDAIQDAFLKLHESSLAKQFAATFHFDAWQPVTLAEYSKLEQQVRSSRDAVSKTPQLTDVDQSPRELEFIIPPISTAPSPVFAFSDISTDFE